MNGITRTDLQILTIAIAIGVIATAYMFSPSSYPAARRVSWKILLALLVITALCFIGMRWAVQGF